MNLLKHIKSRIMKDRSILITWLVSYISILLIPIIIAGFVFFESTRIVEREINSNNAVMLKQIQKAIDKKMADIERLSIQIAWNSKLQSIIYSSKPMNSHGRYVISEIRKELFLCRIANGYIDEIYIYLHNSEMFVNSKASYSMDLLETVLADYEKISAHQFRQLSAQKHIHLFTVLEINNERNIKTSAIAFIQSLPYVFGNEVEATMVILMNSDTFLEEISSIEGIEEGTVLILDEKNEVVAATNSDDNLLNLNYDEFHDEVLLYKRIGDQEFVMSSISSQMNKWKYIFILPSTVFMEKVKYIKSLIWCSIILCLLIGGMVAYIFTRKNYDPIQKITEAIASRAGIELNPNLNEYSFIQQAINNTLDEKEIIREKMEKQTMTLRSAFLARLIKGSSDQIVPIDEALSLYNIKWISNSFCVMLFYIEDFKQLFNETSLSDSIKQLKLVKFIITNVAEELISRKHLGFVTEVDDIMACLINVDEQYNKNVEDELVEMATEIQSFIRDNFYINITISIGSIHKTIVGISKSYQEAQEAMEYRLVMGSGRIIRYNEIENPGNCYDYPLEVEQQLINSIKLGNFETAESIINDVFQRHFSGEMLSIEMTKCLLFDLMSTMIKVVNDISLPDSDIFIEDLKPIARLSGSNTVSEMKYEMMDILKRVCEYIDSNKKDRNKQIIEQIISIIQNNYTDPNLSITSIASNFGLTGPYVSKIFRDQMGEGIQDYINKLRLEEAKTLLKKQHLNLEEIAYKVGYSNSNGLIRVFKKYEGMTPGQFRKMSY